MKRDCAYCKEQFEGRIDKKFCSSYCRSAFHYKQNKDKGNTRFKKIDQQLKKNRKILKSYNKAGLATIRKEKLLAEGFNPRYFTHYWKSSRGLLYLFCYEYGYLDKTEANKEKYILVKWQDYMNQ